MYNTRFLQPADNLPERPLERAKLVFREQVEVGSPADWLACWNFASASLALGDSEEGLMALREADERAARSETGAHVFAQLFVAGDLQPVSLDFESAADLRAMIEAQRELALARTHDATIDLLARWAQRPERSGTVLFAAAAHGVGQLDAQGAA